MQTRTKRRSSKLKNAKRRVFLESLADIANSKHKEGIQLKRRLLYAYKEVGQALIQAKRKVKHGQWSKWVRDNLDFKLRTCQDYMEIAKKWDKIVPHLKNNEDLSMADAFRILRRQPDVPEVEHPAPEGTIPRKVLVEQLKTVEPGTSPKGTIQQSEFFAVQDRRVFTYNDEVAVSGPCMLDFDHPIVFRAHPFLDALEMFPDEHVKVSLAKHPSFRKPEKKSEEVKIVDWLFVHGKNRQQRVETTDEVLLPLDFDLYPEEWIQAPEDFLEALQIAIDCSSTDPTRFSLTCIHITPKGLEAVDNYQAVRYAVKTGLETDLLIRRDSAKQVLKFKPEEYASTEAWFHFRKGETIMSCRRHSDDYPNLGSLVKYEGTPIELPDSYDFTEAIKRADKNAKDDRENDWIQVKLKPGKLYLEGTGLSSQFKERFRIGYDGDPLQFVIDAKILKKLACLDNLRIAKDGTTIQFKGNKFIYVASCEQPKE